MAKVGLSLLSAACLWLSFGCIAFAGTPKGKGTPGWVGRIMCQEYGELHAYLSNDGVRMENNEFRVLVMPPDCKLSIYDMETRRYMEQKVAGFEKLKTVEEMRKDGWVVDDMGIATICGVKCQHYITRKSAKGKARIQLWATKEVNIPTPLINACSRFFNLPGIPEGSGLPVRVWHEANGRKYIYIDTHEIKREAIPPNTYKKPTGFKLVGTPVELMLNEDEK